MSFQGSIGTGRGGERKAQGQENLGLVRYFCGPASEMEDLL